MQPELPRQFLAGASFAVVGASRERRKYGNRVYRALRTSGRRTFAVNPNVAEVEGDPAWPTLSELPERPDVVVLVVPPEVGEGIVLEMGRLGLSQLWLQPGAQSPALLSRAEALGIRTVHSGPCVLVELGKE